MLEVLLRRLDSLDFEEFGGIKISESNLRQSKIIEDDI